MNTFTPNKKEIKALLDLADESLRSARLRLKEEFYRGAVSDSYYTVFYITKALLLSKGFISKTHTGTVRLFGENFIKTGIVGKKYGQWLTSLLQERTEADYDALREFDFDEANQAVKFAEDFFEGTKNLLKK